MTIPQDIPQDEELEKWLLGTCLHKPDIMAMALEEVKEDYFHSPDCKTIWRVFRKLSDAGREVTVATVSAQFVDDLSKKAIQYLVDYVSFNSAEDVRGSYIEPLRDMYRKRALKQELDEAQRILASPDISADDLCERLETAMYDLASEKEKHGPSLAGWEESLKFLEIGMSSDTPVGLMTGYSKLDEMLGGMHKGDLLILGGRPSMGKTSLAVCIAQNVAEQGGTVLFNSLEMSRRQLNEKRQAILSSVSARRMRRADISQDEFSRILALQDNKRFYVDHERGITPTTIMRRARRLKRQQGLSLIVVDYLQLLRVEGYFQGRYEVVTEISNMLKTIAGELEVPVLALAQLSRGLESREDKRPQMGDLKESGAIEQDADAVCFVYRDEYYLEREYPQKYERESDEKYSKRLADYHTRLQAARGKVDIICQKNRFGSVGTVTMDFIGETTAFKDAP